MLQYCFCLMFWLFGHKACRILAPWPGAEPSPPALEGEILTIGSAGQSQGTLWIRSSVVYPSAISPPHPLWVSDLSMYLQKCCEWGNKPKLQASLRQAQTLPIPGRRTGDLKCMPWAQGTRSAVSPARNQEEVLSVAHGMVNGGEGQLVRQG